MRSATLVIALTAASAAFAQKDWPTFGHDLAGTRYSTLKQIDAKNVTRLVRAWAYHMNANAPPPAAAAPAPGSSDAGDAAAGGPPGGVGGSEVSPLVIEGVMYLTTGGPEVVALEPETGNELWAYDVTDGASHARSGVSGGRQPVATVSVPLRRDCRG